MEKSRLTREQLYIQIALLISQRATCCRLAVGAVAIKDNRIIHTGYNGPAKGEAHCNPIDCDVDRACVRAVHAEHNLIKSAHELGIDLRGSKIFVTHQPCLGCSRHIVRAGIEEVYYLHPYRLEDGLINLLNNEIKIYQVDEQGKCTRRQPLDTSKVL